jgi:hypothetical protein
LWETQTETQHSSFVQKQVIRAEKMLTKRLKKEKIQNTLNEKKKIEELKEQLANLSAQNQDFQAKVEIPLK